ncbi:MAG: VOC family protein [Candidatus Rokubacteria bacterium]|nr:VOC family protein [Candidatus Rokubacteria bacterium]
MARITSYLHAGITVKDLERARRFYSELLGLKEIVRPDLGFPGIWYGVGACQLHLMVPPEGRPAGEPEGAFAGRVRHLALGVEGWEALTTRLRAEDVPVRESAPTPGGPRRVFVKDPDDNVLELVEETP